MLRAALVNLTGNGSIMIPQGVREHDSDIITRVFFFYLSKMYPNGYIAVGCFLFLQEQIKDHHHHLLQAHRETEAHFTAAGMSSQRNQSDSFRFKRAAFYQSLKSQVGLAGEPKRRR